jgi:hypothetical protein
MIMADRSPVLGYRFSDGPSPYRSILVGRGEMMKKQFQDLPPEFSITRLISVAFFRVFCYKVVASFANAPNLL